MNDISGRTEDLLALHQPHPAEQAIPIDEREDHTRHFGKVCLGGGLTIGILNIVGSLSATIATESRLVPKTPAGAMLSTVAFVAITAIAAALIVIGGIERLNRPHRSAVRQALAGCSRVEDRLRLVAEQVAPLPGRLAAIERVIDKVPQYPEAVLDGIDLARGSSTIQGRP